MTLEAILDSNVSKDMQVTDEDNETKKRFDYVIEYFKRTNPNPTTELKYRNGYELLVATILSAQTQDKRVNIVTPALFEKYPTPEALAKANPDDVYPYINSVNYSENKSNYIVATARMLVSRYGGKIPENDDDLQSLPGVGRKTAHVILATLFNQPVIAVDTHVLRVAERIGLTTAAEKPLESEEQLVLYTPKEVKSKISHWLILHGRYVCTARNPQCIKCGINKICRYYNV